MLFASATSRGAKDEFLAVTQEIPLELPILERWLGKAPRLPFRGVTALLIQHQFGNQVPLARATLELGLDPARLFWLDVPYTSNARVREAVIGLGVPRRNLLVANDYRILDPYAPYQRRRTQGIIRNLLDDPPERLLVLDDGAYFLEAASCFRRRLPQVAVVEQTRRGIIKLEKSAAMREYARSLAVVNVAESEPKRALESPFIGRAVCAALRRELEGRFPPRARGRCLVLGYGAIGSQVAQLATDYLGFERGSISVYEVDPERLRQAKHDHYSIWSREDLTTRFQLVVGCSGQASFSVHDRVYLEQGAVLASASSGSVELSRDDFIELADSSDIDDIGILRSGLNEADIHSDIRFRLVDREATFLNGGFPVNFTGHVNCIPHRYMQPTVTMMVAAAVQAVQCKGGGVIPLDPTFCAWLDAEFRNELGADVSRFLTPGPDGRSRHAPVSGADAGL